MFLESLIKQYGVDGVIHQYRDPRYPFNCDFYIPSEDLFIEYHGTWTHGDRPFNASDKECIKTLLEWKSKAPTSTYYQVAIYNWTDLDVRKLNTFRENNLNFMIIYPTSNLIITK